MVLKKRFKMASSKETVVKDWNLFDQSWLALAYALVEQFGGDA